MIAAGLPATQTDFDGIPALTAAAQFGNLDVVRVLKELGPRSMIASGDSLIFLNTQTPDTAAVDIWLDALIAAAGDTTQGITNLPLVAGMRWSQAGPTGMVEGVPKHHSGMYGAPETPGGGTVVVTQAPAGSPGGGSGARLVHAAAEAGDVPLLARLLACGVPLDDTTRYGHSPLRLAVREQKVGTVQWLVENGARGTTGGDSRSAINAVFVAIPWSGSEDVARRDTARAITELLLRALRPDELRDSETALSVVRRTRLKTPALLGVLDALEPVSGAQRSIIADRELTALAIAIYLDAPSTAVTLLDAGARPTANGLTRLWGAAQCGGVAYGRLRKRLVRARLCRPQTLPRSACQRLREGR